MIFNQIKHKGQNNSIEITANILPPMAGDTAQENLSFKIKVVSLY